MRLQLADHPNTHLLPFPNKMASVGSLISWHQKPLALSFNTAIANSPIHAVYKEFPKLNEFSSMELLPYSSEKPRKCCWCIHCRWNHRENPFSRTVLAIQSRKCVREYSVKTLSWAHWEVQRQIREDLRGVAKAKEKAVAAGHGATGIM